MRALGSRRGCDCVERAGLEARDVRGGVRLEPLERSGERERDLPSGPYREAADLAGDGIGGELFRGGTSSEGRIGFSPTDDPDVDTLGRMGIGPEGASLMAGMGPEAFEVVSAFDGRRFPLGRTAPDADCEEGEEGRTLEGVTDLDPS